MNGKNIITAKLLLGLFIGFAGVITIFSNYMGEFKNQSFLFGVGLSLISVLAWSFGSVYSSRQKTTVPILFAVGLQMLIAGVIMTAVCAITGQYVNLFNAGSESIFSLLYLIVFGSLVAYSAYVYAISKLPPTLVSIYAYINPVVAVGLGWLILSEKMSPVMLLGMLITLAGVWMVNRESSENSGLKRRTKSLKTQSKVDPAVQNRLRSAS
jgi:drug/metabolite transporter (DMT)-like permease